MREKTGGRVINERLLETVENYIKEHQRTKGKSPTLRQIMHAYPREFPALSKVQRYVTILKREGKIEDDNGKIGISWQVKKNGDTVMILDNSQGNRQKKEKIVDKKFK